MWDLRTAGCVQRFDSHVNHRYQCGVAVSPCLRYLSAGGEDGCVYLYDTRRLKGHLARIVTGGDVITDVAFNTRHQQMVAVAANGTLTTYMS